MEKSTRPPSDELRVPNLTAAEVHTRRAMAVVLLGGLGFSACAWLWTGLKSPGVIATTGPSAIKAGIDPNAAAWYELAQLPGLGESAGRAIVAYRLERERAGQVPAFKNAADLEPVPGIGTATIARIAQHLHFGSGQQTTTQPTR